MKDPVGPQPLEIGRVAKPHGIAGAVKIALNWADSDALEHVGDVDLELADGSRRRLAIEWVRPAGKQLLLKLEGVSSRNDAELLRGARLLIERDALPELEPGEYYLVDLVGARVLGPEGPLGEVVEIQVHPTVDSAVVRDLSGKLFELPLAGPWIVRVDTAEKLIELSSLDGLIG